MVWKWDPAITGDIYGWKKKSTGTQKNVVLHLMKLNEGVPSIET